jgi:hypothetical protein
MDAEKLLNEVLEALQSHPDPVFARKAALKEIEDALEGHPTGLCVNCGDGIEDDDA